MEHVFKYQPQTDNYRYEKVVKIEKEYDYLSIIRPHETPQQWANCVRGPLQELLSKREYNVYHVFCLFASFGEGITKKLVKITEIKPKKLYFDGYCRWGYEVESKDLMKNHWNYSCFEAKTEEIPLEPNKSYSLTSSKITTPSMQCSVSVPSLINTNRPREGNTKKLFISSLFAKQINLLLSHLNLPKDTALRYCIKILH
ncbi:19635_t:CDS:2 [Cetraspora pellucida]|uniref:19635_t:CDS:1 n=1 Tax=Cetraspora pellucida TaxID=1433469 RepID=A0A9N9JDM8_9GLOM|nr:19635_t:CDS:2 [Cetraspora pellucida]